jgi:hypothetical protein
MFSDSIEQLGATDRERVDSYPKEFLECGKRMPSTQSKDDKRRVFHDRKLVRLSKSFRVRVREPFH